MKWPFRIVSVLFAAAMVAGIIVMMRPRPIDVDVARVVLAPLDQRVVDDGRARVRERYTVSAPVAGTLARIDLHE
jgi:HlyD family secretion protein